MNAEITPGGINITYSDCPGEREFPFETKPPISDSKGVISYFERIGNENPKAEHWLKKLGEVLASYLYKTFNIKVPEGFPDGYVLFQNVKNYANGTTRNDRYLYGRYRFRSTNEFSPHMFWLVSDKSQPCSCQYCTGSGGGSRKRHASNNFQQKTPKRTKVQSKPKFDSSEQVIQTVYRRGEIVWVDLTKTDDESLQQIAKENIDNISTRYWPGIIYLREKRNISQNISRNKSPASDTTSNSDDSYITNKVVYLVKLLMLKQKVYTDRKTIAPWLTRTRDIPDDYSKAIQKIKIIVDSYTPMNSYKYKESSRRLAEIKDSKERKRLQEMEKFPHYNAILFGTELICVEDIVRLTTVTEMSENINMEPKFLKISSIYEHNKKGIQFTGDGFLRGKLLNEKGKRSINDFTWIPLNKDNEEYTVDLADIAGRFYVAYPNIEEIMQSQSFLKLKDRWTILGNECL
ncbi:8558_t:CDS:2 [Diversispora eburnea]|uniref:8558_t:CDS:1 n=1 Tax=Diversispora eburnea TaxID=1213867 RepID=A0A9N9F936_9GLOM|nr:8558_t:CDS:2 [Diversispora eburnea]